MESPTICEVLERVKAIEKRLEQATPGSWEWWTSNSWKRLEVKDRTIPTQYVLYPYDAKDGQSDIAIKQGDMDFIENAPDDMRFLVKQLRAYLELDVFTGPDAPLPPTRENP